LDCLVVIAILAGAIAPELIFAALDNTNITNVVLIGRLEPPIALALGVWLLRSLVRPWTVAGSLIPQPSRLHASLGKIAR
jgi:drug/metabolite transporter (DMT)-like permease